jgi:Coenzyme PQQ synthesis protein D (PqqD)
MEVVLMSEAPHARSSQSTVADRIDPLLVHQSVLRHNPDVQGTNMDGETVLLDLSTGRYYTLNRLGSVIWELCTGHHTISDIHAVLSDRFDVAPERALDDLVTLVNELIQEGLLQQERR